MDLSTLREKDIRTFPFDKISDVIKALRDIEPLKLSKIVAIEEIGDYLLWVSIIIERINNNEFDELNQKGKKRQKDDLLSILKKLLDDFTISFEINQFAKNQTAQINAQLKHTLRQVEQQKEELFEQLKTQRTDIDLKAQEEKAEIEKVSQQVDKKISDTEHNILSHVLTLMGVFSAVTTIIMSVVITSSSWLNNADAASAVVAFAIPNLVVLISVIVLMSLIYLYNNMDVIFRKSSTENDVLPLTQSPPEVGRTTEKSQNEHKKTMSSTDESIADNVEKSSEKNDLVHISPSHKGKKTNHVFPIIFFSVVLVVIILLSVLLALFAISHTMPSKSPHIRYIISDTEYRITEENKCESTNCECGEHEKYFEFTFEGKSYKIPYDKKYSHNGNLYYCTEHNALE